MKIFLRDSLKSLDPYNRPLSTTSPWEEQLRLMNVPFHPDEGVHRDTFRAPHAIKDADAVVFLHTETQRPNWESDFASSNYLGHLILISRPGGASITPSPNPRVHVCFWGIEHFGERYHPRVEAFVASLLRGQPIWGALRPAATERLWALRLLCEATQTLKTSAKIAGVQWVPLLGTGTAVELRTHIEADMAELPHSVDITAVTNLLNHLQQFDPPIQHIAETYAALTELLVGTSPATANPNTP